MGATQTKPKAPSNSHQPHQHQHQQQHQQHTPAHCLAQFHSLNPWLALILGLAPLIEVDAWWNLMVTLVEPNGFLSFHCPFLSFPLIVLSFPFIVLSFPFLFKSI